MDENYETLLGVEVETVDFNQEKADLNMKEVDWSGKIEDGKGEEVK